MKRVVVADQPHPLASGRFVVVEQLNHSQWHPRHPTDGMGRAVENYVGALAHALWMATQGGFGVVAVDAAGRLTLMAHPPSPGAQW